ASLGGPIIGHLTFFLSGTIEGQKSTMTDLDVSSTGAVAELSQPFDVPWGTQNDRPIFIMAGVDTVVHQPDQVGKNPTDSISVAIPRFVQYNGTCGDYGAAASAGANSTDAQQIRNNYGYSCQG